MTRIFEIKKAERKNSKILLSIAGQSGSGKTYSALLLARGLVGENGKIVVIDTENGRAEEYAEIPEIGGFLTLPFAPPYSPSAYLEAYRMACDAVGEEGVVIIDSASHEYEGDGGVLDMAEKEMQKAIQKGQKKSIQNWIYPKSEHKKFLNGIVGGAAHTILTHRVTKSTGLDENKKPFDTFSLVAEKNTIFEMKIAIDLQVGTHVATYTKCPITYHSAVVQGQKITLDTGKKIAFAAKNQPKILTKEEVADKLENISDLPDLNVFYKKLPNGKEFLDLFTERKIKITELKNE